MAVYYTAIYYMAIYYTAIYYMAIYYTGFWLYTIRYSRNIGEDTVWYGRNLKMRLQSIPNKP